MAFDSQTPDASPKEDTSLQAGSKDRKSNEIAERPSVVVPEGQKPDIFEYLVGLGDEVLPTAKIEADEGQDERSESAEEEAPAEEKTEEQLKTEALAEKIRGWSKATKIISYSTLKAEESDVAATLKLLFADEAYSDIVHADGQKDTYYYSNRHMTANYVMVAVLVAEKDFAHTVATMVRFNCKTYPAPTDMRRFMDYPYYYTQPQIDRVRDVIKRDERYADIKEVVTGNNKIYFYSEPMMSAGYAYALADGAEYGEHGYQ